MKFAVFALIVLCAACAVRTQVTDTTMAALMRLQMLQVEANGDWELGGKSHAKQLAALKAWAESGFVVVGEVPLSRRNLEGYTIHEGGRIGFVVLLDREASPNDRLYTLAHELAHVHEPQELRTTAESETFAELVAVQVCDRLGLAAWNQTAAYLRTFVAPSTQRDVATRYGADITKLVDTFSKAAAR